MAKTRKPTRPADPHAKDKLTPQGVVPLAFTIAPGREVRNALRARVNRGRRAEKNFASDGLAV